MPVDKETEKHRASVGDKLFFTYLLLALLGIFSAGAAWFTLASIDASHQKVVEKATPMVIESYRLSEATNNLVNLASTLSLVSDLEKLNQLREKIRETGERIDQKIETLEIYAVSTQAMLMEGAKAILSDLESNFDDQYELATQRIFNQQQYAKDQEEALRAIRDIELKLKPVLAKLSLSEKPDDQGRQQAFENFEKQIGEVEGILSQIPFVRSRERLMSLKSSYTLKLRNTTQALVYLDETILKQALASHTVVLFEQLDGANSGIFSTVERDIELNKAIQLKENKNVQLSESLIDLISTTVDSAQAAMTADYEKAESDRRNVQSLLLVLVFLFVSIPLLVLVFYLKPKIIRRLDALAENTRKIAAGDLNTAIDISGQDELGAMARALDQFQRDLVAKRDSEKELHRTHLQLKIQKQALDQFAIVVETDAKGKIIVANSQFCKVSGYTEAELLGHDHREVVGSGYHSGEFWQEMWDTIQSNNIWRGDVCNHTKDKDVYWVDTTIVPICDNGRNEPTRYLAIRFLITDKKKAEEELRLSEERFRLVGELATDGYWDWDLKTNEEYMSPNFKRLFGYEEHEISNRAGEWQKIIHQDDLPKTVEAFEKHTQEGQPFHVPVRYHHKDGSIVWVIRRGVALKNEKGEFYRMIGTHTNITELKQIEAELAESNQELEQFAFIASHDLQEPLRTIMGYVQLIERRYSDRLDEDGREFMQFIVKGSQRMKTLINDLLTYSRAGRAEVEFETFHLGDLIEEILALLEKQIEEQNADIVLPADLPEIKADMRQIRQLLQNLISNALKFSKEGVSPKVHIHYRTEVSSDRKVFHRISVQDNGIGIDNQYFEKMFLIFQRLNHRNRYSGTGIGLAICKKIVERHGGHMEVDSALGEGTTFHFTLPA